MTCPRLSLSEWQRPEGDPSGLLLRLEVVALANAENLKGKGLDSRTASEQREIARKGGQASGAARRLKKMRRVVGEILLDMPVEDRELQRIMERLGIPEEERIYQMAVVVAMLNQAMKGNVDAACFIRDTIGESPGGPFRREGLDPSQGCWRRPYGGGDGLTGPCVGCQPARFPAGMVICRGEVSRCGSTQKPAQNRQGHRKTGFFKIRQGTANSSKKGP